MHYLLTSLRMLGWMTLLTGILYPLLITGIGYLTLRQKSEGSLIYEKGKIIGSTWIGQKFEKPQYFWPRPSAHNYDALNSGGTNFSPTSKDLKKLIDERQAAILKSQEIANKNEIPPELLFASGSGLDPHISPKGARFQIPRIIKARNMNPEKGRKILNDLITEHEEHRFLGFIGEPRVNVLALNLALDKLEH
jgi:K+-transporting ATPase ATPase C chain